MTHKHFSMSKVVIQRNVAIGVFTFVPKVFMVKLHVSRIVFLPLNGRSVNIATFQGFSNENEYVKNTNVVFIAPVTIALCKNEL